MSRCCAKPALLPFLAAGLLAAWAGPARAADLGVQYGSERELDPRVLGAEPHDNASPAAASDGTNTLVVWSDTRTYRQNLWAARVSGAGAVLDQAAFPIETGDDALVAPRVAFDGTNYVVAWYNATKQSLHFRRVTPAGVLLGAAATQVADYGTGHRLACAAGQCLLVWTRLGAFQGTRLDSAGAILDTPALALGAPAWNGAATPELATDGTTWQLVWGDLVATHGQILGMRVSRAGAILTSPAVRLSQPADAFWPQIAFGGGQYLVAWVDALSVPKKVLATRVDAAGAVPDASALTLCTSTAFVEGLAVSALASGFLVAWDTRDVAATPQTGTLSGVRVSAAGAKLDATPLALAGGTDARLYPQLVAGPSSQALAVWEVYRSTAIGNADVFATRLDASGTPLDGAGFPVALAPNHQASPRLAGDATLLVVWEDTRSSRPTNIYAQRTTAAGVPLDAASFALAPSASVQRHPRVAFDGSQFLAVWREDSAGGPVVRGARVTSSGAVLDSPALTLSPVSQRATEPSVAFGGGQYLVTWTLVSSLLAEQDNILGARVSSSGAVIDTTPLVVSHAPNDQDGSEVTSDGGGFFVVWHDWRFGIAGQAFGARVSPAGVVLDPDGVHLSGRASVTNTGQNDWGPQAAFVGDHYLAVWWTQEPGSQIAAMRLTPAGVRLDPTSFAVSSGFLGDYALPALAGDGTTALSFWASSSAVAPAFIGGASVSGGTRGAVPSLDLAADSVAALLQPGGRGLLVYAADDPGLHQSARIRVREITCAGCPGSGAPDAGTPDAGAPDAGSADAGAADAGADAGPMDAGSDDAGDDAGGDAGADAGAPAATAASGCGCQGSGESASLAGFGLLLLLVRRRRSVATSPCAGPPSPSPCPGPRRPPARAPASARPPTGSSRAARSR